MTKLVFVHGWGFDPSFWEGVTMFLPTFDKEFVDLGFKGEENPVIDPNAVYVTHSMGLPWALEHVPSCKGLIAINGFTKFCADENWPDGVAPRMLQRMISQFDKMPEKVWTDFMKNCGDLFPVYSDAFHTQELSEGLKYLSQCDVRQAFESFDGKFMAIASETDRIIPEKLTSTSFGEEVIWYKEGNHLLPLFESQAIAEDILAFLRLF
ncbi:alpha/beta hydrolase [Terasakiella sp. SH-1]|uniref:alpha/beta fold hydrolase n=1 Tax=Terasakiella sp. SH-1 TaxID=2560057 RepID=UPI0010743B84|nr:alpha/beta hydrolase [Terasakiella sp. SH-1]